MKKSHSDQLHTHATPAHGIPAGEHKAMHEARQGGSYVRDPVSGDVQLRHATKAANVSQKHPDAPRHRKAPESTGSAPAETSAE